MISIIITNDSTEKSGRERKRGRKERKRRKEHETKGMMRWKEKG